MNRICRHVILNVAEKVSEIAAIREVLDRHDVRMVAGADASQGKGSILMQASSVAAGATAQFSAEHTIRYPKDVELIERQ